MRPHQLRTRPSYVGRHARWGEWMASGVGAYGRDRSVAGLNVSIFVDVRCEKIEDDVDHEQHVDHVLEEPPKLRRPRQFAKPNQPNHRPTNQPPPSQREENCLRDPRTDAVICAWQRVHAPRRRCSGCSLDPEQLPRAADPAASVRRSCTAVVMGRPTNKPIEARGRAKIRSATAP